MIQRQTFGSPSCCKAHQGLLGWQTRQRAYEKDIGFSFSPFMPILGTGLVTADGELWRTQRLLLGPALRTEMLDEVRERVQQLSGPASVFRVDPNLCFGPSACVYAVS